MGDFLDDYLDGLSSGQRFNPLPYGPYHGTKDKRQWHLLADSEREQAIYEARMLEEEESASAAAEGAAAEGGSSPIPEKLIIDRRFNAPVFNPNTVPGTQVTLQDLSQAVQYEQQNVTETFGLDVDEATGEIAVLSESLPSHNDSEPVVVTVVPDVQATTDWADNSSIMMDAITTGDGVAKVPYNPNDIWIVQIGYGDGSGMETGYPGSFDTNTGYAKPILALGADYALQFKILFGYDSIMSDDLGESEFLHAMSPGSASTVSYMFSIFQAYNETALTGGNPYTMDEAELRNTWPDKDEAWYQYNTGRIYDFYLDLQINIYDSPDTILGAVEAAYQAQSVKYWSYGVIKLS